MEFMEGSEPVSPTGQYLNSSVLCVSIITVLESEVPINDVHIISFLKDVFLAINPRFSSVMVLSLSLSLLCFPFYVIYTFVSNPPPRLLRCFHGCSIPRRPGTVNDSCWRWWCCSHSCMPPYFKNESEKYW
jgi:hypothetical protein